jgi:hypothetical protein
MSKAVLLPVGIFNNSLGESARLLNHCLKNKQSLPKKEAAIAYFLSTSCLFFVQLLSGKIDL